MKNFTSKIIVAFAVTALLTGVAEAQSVSMTAYVPFDFTMGKEKLEAGHYTFVLAGVGSSALTVRHLTGSGTAAAMTHAADADRSARVGRLIFSRYGDDYFLSKAFWPGYSTGRETVKSKAEREIIARNARPAQVELGASGSLVR